MSKSIAIAMGVILLLGGLVSIWQGYDIIQVERGWTEVIAGATAVAGGVITIAIGLLIGVVARFGRDALASRTEVAPEVAVEPAPAFADEGMVEPVEAAAAPEPPRPEELIAKINEPVAGAARSPLFKSRFAAAPPPPPPPAPELSLPDPPDPVDQPFVVAGARIDEALAEKPVASIEGGVQRSAEVGVAESLKEFAAIAPAPPAPSTLVVGRYTFGGSNYVLFDDGSIESETEEGVRRFASLAELRKHMGVEAQNGS